MSNTLIINNFNNETISDYAERLYKALKSIDQSNINLLVNEISKRLDGSSTIYILGNGGSQANANHVVGDYMKSFALAGYKLKINSISDNTCYLTAASNDLDYSEVYSLLVGKLILPNDLIIYLSGSGNSINLVKCAQKANLLKIKQASITSFSGGRLSQIVQIPIHVKVEDMEIAEDAQMSIFHNIKQTLCRNNNKNTNLVSKKYEKRIMDDVVS